MLKNCLFRVKGLFSFTIGLFLCRQRNENTVNKKATMYAICFLISFLLQLPYTNCYTIIIHIDKPATDGYRMPLTGRYILNGTGIERRNQRCMIFKNCKRTFCSRQGNRFDFSFKKDLFRRYNLQKEGFRNKKRKKYADRHYQGDG